MKTSYFKTPLQLIEELGIVSPEDIDIEAICQYCQATVVYEPLQGCEARITGNQDRAIITVNKTSPRTRQRFSAGHELGHWMYDRGEVAFACSENVLTGEWSDQNPETRANRYASNLLLPTELFVPLAIKKPLTLDTVRELGEKFQTSLTATAIRLVEHGSYPGMVVCNSSKGRKWFVRGRDVSNRLWPVEIPGKNTLAHNLLRGSTTVHAAIDADADEWFTHPASGNYTIHEESVRISNELILSLLWWNDEQQLIDLQEEDERIEARRSDWKED